MKSEKPETGSNTATPGFKHLPFFDSIVRLVRLACELLDCANATPLTQRAKKEVRKGMQK
jgi:hypothetical protein